MKNAVALSIISCSSLLKEAVGAVMSIQYFDDSNCQNTFDLVGMQVNFMCFRQVATQGSGSAFVSCTSAGLTVNEYATTDCSGGVTSTVPLITTGFSSGTCMGNPFSTNEYFPKFSGSSVLINCAADDQWFTADDGRYELSRQTTSLDSRSALDYTKENCLENSLATDMDYCYLNKVGEECLPTNSDPSDDSFCSAKALTTYAYSSNCLYDSFASQYVEYHSDNNHAGYMNRACGSSFDEQLSYVVPFSDCLGCSRFKDLKDETVDASALVAILVGVSIAICICCALCCVGVFVCMYGSAALLGLCCRKNNKSSNAKVTEPAHPSCTINTPLHDPAPPPYANNHPQQQPQLQYQQAAGPNAQELLHVQVPPGVTAGMVLLVAKSTGEQVRE